MDIRKELEAKIIKKATDDAAFRQSLISNPAVALKSMGLAVASTSQVTVLEETGGKVFLVLPRSSGDVGADKKLSDAALASVSGGGGGAAPTFQPKCYGCGQG